MGVDHHSLPTAHQWQGLRQRLLARGVSLVVSSYNMASGFYLLRPGAVPATSFATACSTMA